MVHSDPSNRYLTLEDYRARLGGLGLMDAVDGNPETLHVIETDVLDLLAQELGHRYAIADMLALRGAARHPSLVALAVYLVGHRMAATLSNTAVSETAQRLGAQAAKNLAAYADGSKQATTWPRALDSETDTPRQTTFPQLYTRPLKDQNDAY